MNIKAMTNEKSQGFPQKNNLYKSGTYLNFKDGTNPKIHEVLRKGMTMVNCEVLTQENRQIKENYEALGMNYEQLVGLTESEIEYNQEEEKIQH